MALKDTKTGIKNLLIVKYGYKLSVQKKHKEEKFRRS
jgi:hypothetical protein